MFREDSDWCVYVESDDERTYGPMSEQAAIELAEDKIRHGAARAVPLRLRDWTGDDEG